MENIHFIMIGSWKFGTITCYENTHKEHSSCACVTTNNIDINDYDKNDKDNENIKSNDNINDYRDLSDMNNSNNYNIKSFATRCLYKRNLHHPNLNWIALMPIFYILLCVSLLSFIPADAVNETLQVICDNK